MGRGFDPHQGHLRRKKIDVIYLKQEEWGAKLLQLASLTHDEVVISSFNFFEGTETKKLLTILDEKKNATILIGIPFFSPCCNWAGEKICPPCVRNREKFLLRLRELPGHYPNIKWHMTTEWHLKGYMFRRDETWRGLFGGVNLSDSSWTDALVDIFGISASKLVGKIKERIVTSEPLTPLNVEKFGWVTAKEAREIKE